MSLPSLSPGASEIELVASPAAVQSLPSDDLCSAPPSPTSEPTASTAPTSIVPTTSTVEEEEDIKPTLEMVSTQDELDPHLQDVKPEAEFIPLDSDPNITLTPHGLPPVQTKLNTKWADVFFRYCAERHMVYEKKAKGLPKEQWTNDEVIQKTRIGNCYSELDRDSEKVKNEVILAGDQSHQEMCFRVFLFCGFYLMSTWDALVQGLGHIPSWKDFDLKKYEAILYEKSRKGKIYYGGFQLVPPTKYFGGKLPHYAATLRFVQSLMEMDMPSKLLECKYAVDASHIIQTAPTLGGFLSLCMLCYFNEAPHLHWTYRNWASCGPGSRAFLQRIFGQRTINSTPMEQSALVWLHTNQWKYWHNIGIDPPHAWEIGLRPGLRVLDIENSLCWCHRYVHSAERKGYGSVLNKGPLLQREGDASMPAWCDEEQYTRGKNQVAFKGDYTEEKDKLAALEADQGVFEIEKVVCRTGNRKDKDGLFRVRWKGYPPEEDTWERASNLRNGAAEALKEWLEWENRVHSSIEKVALEYPFKPIKREREQSAISRRGPATSRRLRILQAASREEAEDVKGSILGETKRNGATTAKATSTPRGVKRERQDEADKIDTSAITANDGTTKRGSPNAGSAKKTRRTEPKSSVNPLSSAAVKIESSDIYEEVTATATDGPPVHRARKSDHWYYEPVIPQLEPSIYIDPNLPRQTRLNKAVQA